MAKIIDYDELAPSYTLGDLGSSANVVFDVSTKLIHIQEYGNLTSDGLTLACLYSLYKYKYDFGLILPKEPVAMETITDEQYNFVNGWKLADAASILLIRDGGFTVVDTNGIVTALYPCLITQSPFAAGTDKAYYQVEDGGDPIDINLADQINQCVLAYEILETETAQGDYTFDANNTLNSTGSDFTTNFSSGDQVEVKGSANGNDGVYTVDSVTATEITVEGTPFTTGADNGITVYKVNDYRNFMKLYLREEGKKYDSADVVATVGTLQHKRYPISLGNEIDPKVSESDATVDAYGVTISWYDVAQVRNISGVNKDFQIIIDGNDKTAEQIYMAVQSMLRKSTNINSNSGSTGVRRGDIQPEMLTFVGNDLFTLFNDLENKGVFIDSFQLDDINRVYFQDDTNTEVSFDYVATFSFLFNEFMQNDPEAKFFTFFANAGGNLWPGQSAILVDQNSGENIVSTGLSFAANTISAASGLDLFSDGDKILVIGSSDNDGLYTVSGNSTATTITVVETMTATGADAVSIEVSSRKVAGYVDGNAQLDFDFNYDNNNQGGRTPATPAAIIFLGIGHSFAQQFKGVGTIVRQTGQKFSFANAQERNFKAPTT